MDDWYTNAMKLKALKQDFLHHLSAIGRSAKTIENYDRYLTYFLATCPVADTDKLTIAHIQAFEVALANEASFSRKPVTQNYYRTALRMLLRYAGVRGIATVKSTAVTLVAHQPAPTTPLTERELTRLIGACDGVNPIGRRDRALMHVFIDTGLRVAELAALSLDDVDLRRRTCTLQRKGHTCQLTFLPETKQALLSYLKMRKDNDSALFVQHGKNHAHPQTLRLSVRTIERIIVRRAVAAGITTPVTPNVLRVSVLRQQLRAGVSLDTVQIMLGHQHQKSTRRYG